MRPLTRTGNPLLAVGTAALLFVSVVAWQPVFAANAPADPIAQMEVKYFEHTYPNDTQEQRLDRLEKLVFGEVRTGSDDERVSSLLAAIPNLSAAPSQDAGSSSGSSGGDGQGSQTQAAGQDQTATGQDQGADQSAYGGNAQDYSEYPSVTALEMFFFHKSFQGEPVKHRLDQLESKAFGHVNAAGDLSDRVDKLEEAARKQNHGVGVDPTSKTEATQGSNGMGGPMMGAAPQYVAPPQYGAPQYGAPQNNSPMPPAGWQSAGTGLNANIDQLEQMEFGRIFGQMSLLDRVKQLETRIFPHEVVDANASIPDRVNTMMHAVHLSSGTAPGAFPGYAATQGQAQSPPYYGNPAYNPNAYASAAPQTAYGGASGMYGAGQTQYAQPQYSQPQYGQQSYGQPQYGTAGNTAQYQAANQQQEQQQQQQQQNKGHPLMKGLARVLGAVGSMALNSVGSMNFGSGGYGMPYGSGMPFGGYPTGGGGFWP